MKIKKIRIKNFKSIKDICIEVDNFNLFVGQNNHGKTNFFQALQWFFNGSGNKEELLHKKHQGEEMYVEIEFDGVQEAISKMSNDSNKSTIRGKLGDTEYVHVIRKFGESKRLVKKDIDEEYTDPGTGFDKSLNDFLPKLEYVPTTSTIKDKAKYGKKTEIGQMLSGLVDEILKAEDPRYKKFYKTFEELFLAEDSKMAQELNNVSDSVANNLRSQFPECSEVDFEIDKPNFEDLLKGFKISMDDGVKTPVHEKGDGLQRALMLAIVQTFAEYRKKHQGIKNFIFIIDEAELHLHPTAQRKLKSTLLKLALNVDQVFVSAHSSVFLSDAELGQYNFKVLKESFYTKIDKINDIEKQHVIYDLLGGSPSDILLPNNFLIVEGRSEFEFLQRVIHRFYSDKKEKINIIQANGFLSKTKNRMEAIHQAFLPLVEKSNRKPIFRNSLVVIHDHSCVDNKKEYERFLEAYPDLIENKQLFDIGVGCIEDYYPNEYLVGNSDVLDKVELARVVGENITLDQFKSDMAVLFDALEKLYEYSI